MSVGKNDLPNLWQSDSILKNPEIFPIHAKIQFIPQQRSANTSHLLQRRGSV